MIQHLDDLLQIAGKTKKMKLAVAAAQDEDVLKAVSEAAKMKIVEPLLFGNVSEIREIADRIGMDLSSAELIQCEDFQEAAAGAVHAVSSGKADFLMKGLTDTSVLLKAVLKKEAGLRTNRLLSHVMVYSPQAYHKLLLLTDGGMNITPDLQDKKEILMNALEVARALGIVPVKVACLAAKEKVDDKMEATIDAAKLAEAQTRGIYGENVIVDGPMAFDLAVSKEACKIKKFESPVAGDADILLVPNIEMGNGIGKAMTYMAQAASAGIIMGARVPIVLVSRADEFKTKLYSIALGSMIAMNKQT